MLQVAHEQFEAVTTEYFNQAQRLTPLPLLPREMVESGKKDLVLKSWDEYAELGLRRITGLLDKHNVKGTLVCNGIAAQRYPDAVRLFKQGGGGREVCAHSWSQDLSPHVLNRQQMKDNARRCVETITKVAGERPVGWVSPGGQFNDHTPAVLAEEGYIWHGDYANTDSAFTIETESGKIVGMSLPWDVNDVMYIRMRIPPSHYVELFCRSFDILYEEGGQILPAVAHTCIYGRSFGIWAYDQVIKYAKSYPNVWFTTRQEIAEWYLEQYG
ncbi:polysaccharide deacetylase family protein [Bacteroidota bacterium]